MTSSACASTRRSTKGVFPMSLAKRILSLIPVALLLANPAHGTGLERDAVAAWTTSHQHVLLDEYEALLRLPNVATDRDAIRLNADELMRMMQRRGLSPRLVENADESAPPAVYGEWAGPAAHGTLGI